MNSKERFEKLLKEIFLGVNIEGDSAIANLLSFKSKYYESFIYDLSEKIAKTNAAQEIYDKLYDFFSSYFNESGSLFFANTPKWKKKYARLSNKDVELFYKTKDLYYIKTQKVYNPLKIKVNRFSFKFNVDNLGERKGNEKKEIEFLFTNFNREKKLVEFKVKYKQNEDYSSLKKLLGIDKPEKIRKYLFEKRPKEIKYVKNYVFENLDKLKPSDIDILIYEKEKNSLFREIKVEFVLKKIEAVKKIANTNLKDELEEEIKEAFRVYKKQSSVDYFIHKDAEKFLKEQFDLFMFEYMYGEIFDEKRLKVLKDLKEIAYEFIEKIAAFENELKAIYLKPRFVFNSNYVITKDRLEKYGVLDEFLSHKGMEEQIKEWKELKIIDDNFDMSKINDEKYKFLPFDTKYFKNIEIKLLEKIDNLDDELDGKLIHSENFQALNTILPKYKNSIDLIYIDPPFNTGKDFDYLDRFQDSTWLTLMENRISLAYELLSKRGSLFLHLDYNANYLGRFLLNEIFGKDNFLNEIVWFYERWTTQTKKLQNMHDYIHWIGKNFSKLKIFKITEELSKDLVNRKQKGWNTNTIKQGEKKLKQLLVYDWDIVNKAIKEGKIDTKKYDKIIDATKKEKFANDVWNIQFINPMSKERVDFSTQKPEKLLQKIIELASDKHYLILDFFAGSGTTSAAAHKLKRKWIGIEMGEHFYSIVLPRMKKVLAGVIVGISKELEKEKKLNKGGFFKYFELEQYEDILKKAKYKDNLETSLKLAYAIEIEDEKSKINLNKIYPDKEIDIAETMSNLLGEKIKKITKDKIYLKTKEIDLEDFTFENYPEVRKLIYWE